MIYDIENFVAMLVESLRLFYYSPFVFVIKILIGIYLLIIFADIMMLLVLRDVPQHLRVGLKGMDIKFTSKKKMKKRWIGITKRLVGENEAQLKIAIIEADAIAEEVLSGMGYTGANMVEKLEQVAPAHLDDHLEALKGAHEIRNRVVNELEFVIDQRMAVAVVGVYENFLKYLDLL